MKILHLLASNKFSGAENVASQIIKMFKNTDMNMVYCSPDGPIAKSLLNKDIKFEPLKKLSVENLKKILKKIQPDIIHAHDMKACYYAARACGKIKLISHIHNNAFSSQRLSIKSIAYFLAARKAEHVFWVSQSAFDGYIFHNKLKKKSSILYNIIDVETVRRQVDQDEMLYNYDVVFVGRLTYEKDPLRLIEVFSILVSMKQDVKIAIIGTGELEKAIKEKVIEYDLQDRIDFLGFKENPFKIMSSAKAMILTSRWEGVPMCVLEAMALGVPIVSTPVDGLKEIIDDGKNGFLSSQNKGLAEKLYKIITDQNLHSVMSKNCLIKAKKINDKNVYMQELQRAYYEE